MLQWTLPAVLSATLVLAAPAAIAASTKDKSSTATTASKMVEKKRVYSQPVNPVIIRPAAKPVRSNNFAAPAFDCRPGVAQFDGSRCGY